MLRCAPQAFSTKIYVWLKKNFVTAADERGYMELETLIQLVSQCNGFLDGLVVDVTKFG